jgi:hypothetical protein
VPALNRRALAVEKTVLEAETLIELGRNSLAGRPPPCRAIKHPPRAGRAQRRQDLAARFEDRAQKVADALDAASPRGPAAPVLARPGRRNVRRSTGAAAAPLKAEEAVVGSGHVTNVRARSSDRKPDDSEPAD